MNIDKYNTRVRQAMSEEYVKCTKRKSDTFKKIVKIENRLRDESETLTYKEYITLEKEREYLLRRYDMEDVRLSVWDMAREICLSIADEC